MRFDKLQNLFKWGFFGGLIAIIGFWIFSPQTESVLLFVMLRAVIGLIVAMIVGPILSKNKSNVNKKKTS